MEIFCHLSSELCQIECICNNNYFDFLSALKMGKLNSVSQIAGKHYQWL